MANLRPDKTGVTGAVIWISVGTGLRHGPRVKVMLGTRATEEALESCVSVTITHPPRVLGTLPAAIERKVLRFVELNHDVLLQHWRDEIDALDVGPLLRRA